MRKVSSSCVGRYILSAYSERISLEEEDNEEHEEEEEEKCAR